MKIAKLKDFTNGWFIGDFEPSILKTKDVEVCYKEYKKGAYEVSHYHKISTEFNLLIYGKMLLNDISINQGEIFILYPNEWSHPIYLTDCGIAVVRFPSAPKDKYLT